MPEPSAKPRGQASRGDARSVELAKNVVTTRLQLENHFKNIRKREADFRKQKLVLLEPQLKAAERVARPSSVAVHKSRMQGGASPRALGGSPNHSIDSPRSTSSAPRSDAALGAAGKRRGLGSPSKNSDFAQRLVKESDASRLDRCWSSPGDLYSPSSTHSKLVNAWQTRPGSPGMSVCRAAASVPVSSHPPSHPGAASSRPSVARPARSIAVVGSPGSPAGRAGGWGTPGSPITPGPVTPLMAPTPEAQSAVSSPSRPQVGLHDSMRSFANWSGATSPSCSSPTQRRTAGDRGLLSNLFSEPGDFQEELLLAAVDAEEEGLSGLIAGGAARRPADPPEMIERLGGLMALLGPRYKTLPKEFLWKRAATGEMTPAQRKLFKSGGHGAADHLQRPRPSASAPALLGESSDPDGKARAAWLAACAGSRALQRKKERAERGAASNASGNLDKEPDLVDGASAGKAALVAYGLD